LVDIFSKYTTVVPVHGKTSDEVLDALIEGLRKMKGKPKVIYSDNEGAFSSNAMVAYLKEHKTYHNSWACPRCREANTYYKRYDI